MLRTLLAPNPSPMTLQGTQTYIIGRERCAIIDPGPDSAEHLDAVAQAVSGGVSTYILVTHAHSDHDAGAAALAERLVAPILSAERGLQDGDVIPTDEGDLIALHTPGHTPDHMSFWWPIESAIFCVKSPSATALMTRATSVVG